MLLVMTQVKPCSVLDDPLISQFLKTGHSCEPNMVMPPDHVAGFQSHSTLEWFRRYFGRIFHTFFSAVSSPTFFFFFFSVELITSLLLARQSFVTPHGKPLTGIFWDI